MSSRKLVARCLAPVLLLVGLSSAGCATDASVISQANAFHTQLEPAVVSEQVDPVLDAYLQEINDRIVVAAAGLQADGYIPKASRDQDNRWMFSGKVKAHFVNSKTINAFTTGGEHLYIYSELFEKCSTEDELAAVMAHEFAHIYGRHVHKGMNRQLLIMGAAAGAGAAGYALAEDDDRTTYAAGAAGAAMLAGQIYGMSRTRGDEDEADKIGFQIYVRAGYDPARFADFFRRMIEMGFDQSSDMLSDHPKLSTRVQNTDRRIAALPPDASRWRQPPVATPAEFKQYQARAADKGKTMPTDQTLGGTQDLLAALPRSCLTPAILPDQVAASEHLAERARQAEHASQDQAR